MLSEEIKQKALGAIFHFDMKEAVYYRIKQALMIFKDGSKIFYQSIKNLPKYLTVVEYLGNY